LFVMRSSFLSNHLATSPADIPGNRLGLGVRNHSFSRPMSARRRSSSSRKSPFTSLRDPIPPWSRRCAPPFRPAHCQRSALGDQAASPIATMSASTPTVSAHCLPTPGRPRRRWFSTGTRLARRDRFACALVRASLAWPTMLIAGTSGDHRFSRRDPTAVTDPARRVRQASDRGGRRLLPRRRHRGRSAPTTRSRSYFMDGLVLRPRTRGAEATLPGSPIKEPAPAARAIRRGSISLPRRMARTSSRRTSLLHRGDLHAIPSLWSGRCGFAGDHQIAPLLLACSERPTVIRQRSHGRLHPLENIRFTRITGLRLPSAYKVEQILAKSRLYTPRGGGGSQRHTDRL